MIIRQLVLFTIVFCCTLPALFSQSANLLYRQAQIKAVLKTDIPVLRLPTVRTPALLHLQDMALKHPALGNYLYRNATGLPMLNEVFLLSAARATDLPQLPPNSGKVWRLELYNFALNRLAIVWIDSLADKVVDIQDFPAFQPDIPPHLAELAVDIALHAPEVQQAFGAGLSAQAVRMASAKTALNRSRCQRSQHLCVAPTFVKGEKALWAIVDLTDLDIAGVKWTQVGQTGPALTERSVQNDNIMRCFCDIEQQVQRNGWQFDYSISRSDGLVVSNVRYNNQPMYHSIKTVDWHVSYSNTDGFGYSDAIGCPEYSQSAVVAIEPPRFEAILEGNDTIGFCIVQDYFSEGWPTPCSYNYRQRFAFYNDGSCRPAVASLGRGCGNTATYRPVTRIALAGEGATFGTFKDNNWQPWNTEQWFKETELTAYSSQQRIAKISRKNANSLFIEANKGQFPDGGLPDQAFYYVTKRHPDLPEGDQDLPTIGPCCNTDYHQGPEKFMEPLPESLTHAELVLWYVPEVHNNDAKDREYCWAESVLENGVYVPKIYPCFTGPKLVLEK